MIFSSCIKDSVHSCSIDLGPGCDSLIHGTMMESDSVPILSMRFMRQSIFQFTLLELLLSAMRREHLSVAALQALDLAYEQLRTCSLTMTLTTFPLFSVSEITESNKIIPRFHYTFKLRVLFKFNP
jgi:hypothetical protein